MQQILSNTSPNRRQYLPSNPILQLFFPRKPCFASCTHTFTPFNLCFLISINTKPIQSDRGRSCSSTSAGRWESSTLGTGGDGRATAPAEVTGRCGRVPLLETELMAEIAPAEVRGAEAFAGWYVAVPAHDGFEVITSSAGNLEDPSPASSGVVAYALDSSVQSWYLGNCLMRRLLSAQYELMTALMGLGG
ncbi:hypothetical protein KCU78_g28, partial [Aureobasidium melanogenum]